MVLLAEGTADLGFKCSCYRELHGSGSRPALALTRVLDKKAKRCLAWPWTKGLVEIFSTSCATGRVARKLRKSGVWSPSANANAVQAPRRRGELAEGCT
jgi:hypothetical protein